MKLLANITKKLPKNIQRKFIKKLKIQNLDPKYKKYLIYKWPPASNLASYICIIHQQLCYFILSIDTLIIGQEL